MGISAGGSGGGPKSDINVTPLVDVVLVLLIIFLVTMPVLMRHLTIEVPRKLDSDHEISLATPLTILAKADGSIVISEGSGNETTVNRIDLPRVLRERLESKDEDQRTVFVDFEDHLPYNEVVSVMDAIKGAGKKTGEDGSDAKIALKIREADQAK